MDSSLNKHKEAVDNFKKALELEPDNESYKSNLQIAEDKVSSGVSPGNAGFPGMFQGMGGPGGMDLGAFLNNPALMNMATTMLSDPNMQQMMNQMMAASMQPQSHGSAPTVDQAQMMGQMMSGLGGVPGQAGQPGQPPASMESLLQAGQQLAQQMQASNPDLVDQLRRQMQGPGGPGGPFPPPEGGNPPQ